MTDFFSAEFVTEYTMKVVSMVLAAKHTNPAILSALGRLLINYRKRIFFKMIYPHKRKVIVEI
jgi:hypothetical protein